MTETTRTQDAVAEEMALRYGRVRVSALRQGGSVLLVGMTDDVERDRRAVGPDGEPACECCGGTSGLADRGVYGFQCEFCWDLWLAQR